MIIISDICISSSMQVEPWYPEHHSSFHLPWSYKWPGPTLSRHCSPTTPTTSPDTTTCLHTPLQVISISPVLPQQVAWPHSQQGDQPHHITRHHHLPPYSITSHLHFTSLVTTSGLAPQPAGRPTPPHHQTPPPASILHYKSSPFHQSCHYKWPGPTASRETNPTTSPDTTTCLHTPLQVISISPVLSLQVAWPHSQQGDQPHHITRHHHLPPYSITSHLHFTSLVTTSGLALQPAGRPTPPHHQTPSPASTLHYTPSQWHSVSISPVLQHQVAWPHSQQGDHPHHITRHHHLPSHSITSHLSFTQSPFHPGPVTTSGLALSQQGTSITQHHHLLPSPQHHCISISPDTVPAVLPMAWPNPSSRYTQAHIHTTPH